MPYRDYMPSLCTYTIFHQRRRSCFCFKIAIVSPLACQGLEKKGAKTRRIPHLFAGGPPACPAVAAAAREVASMSIAYG